MKYVVDYEVWTGGGLDRPGQCDITTRLLDLDDPGRREDNFDIAAERVTQKTILRDGERIVVTDVRAS